MQVGGRINSVSYLAFVTFLELDFTCAAFVCIHFFLACEFAIFGCAFF